jgi:hypothetical protein
MSLHQTVFAPHTVNGMAKGEGGGGGEARAALTDVSVEELIAQSAYLCLN